MEKKTFRTVLNKVPKNFKKQTTAAARNRESAEKTPHVSEEPIPIFSDKIALDEALALG
ncbi:hypothetical protein [Streptococcus sp.]|uniref:hypothetical protein n=1 Tax=Streptococcus sp. TaxID=1306 RepID=UPI0035A00EB3